MSVIFGGTEKPLENPANDNKKQALPIQILLWIINNRCETMVVAVLVQENVNLIFSTFLGSKIPLLPAICGGAQKPLENEVKDSTKQVLPIQVLL